MNHGFINSCTPVETLIDMTEDEDNPKVYTLTLVCGEEIDSILLKSRKRKRDNSELRLKVTQLHNRTQSLWNSLQRSHQMINDLHQALHREREQNRVLRNIIFTHAQWHAMQRDNSNCDSPSCD